MLTVVFAFTFRPLERVAVNVARFVLRRRLAIS
jgi:hypothetical protein